MDRLHAMSVFACVVEAGSLSAAARQLKTPLPTVSRKLSQLEAHLKARLLHRSTRHLDLTDAGRQYYGFCKRLLEEVAEAERAAAGEYSAPRGELTVCAPIVFGRLHVLPIITAFLQAHPQVRVRLILGDGVLDLLEAHIDVAIRIADLPDSRLMAIGVGHIRRVVCASPAYFASQGQPNHPRDLAAHQCIAFEGLSSAGQWIFRSQGKPCSAAIRPRLTVNTAEAAVDAALAGAGLTQVLSYQVRRQVQDGTLALALRRFEPAPVSVSLVYPNQRRLALKLRAFLDFSAPRLRARIKGTEPKDLLPA